MKSPKTVRYGIIGYGLFAERAIAPAIQASPHSQLVALQKRSLEAARTKATARSVPRAFSSVTELCACSDVDAVFVASANSAHCDEVIIAARAGKHVLVEKPMALNARDAERMVAECDKNGVKLMVAHVLRFSPLLQDLRAMVQSGLLGRIISARSDYSFDARFSHRSWLYDPAIAGGGAVFDIGVHCLDSLCFVLDDRVESVQAMLTPEPTSASLERSAVINLRFSGGSLGSISCSFEGPFRHTIIEVIGSEGIAHAFDFTSSEQTTHLFLERKGADRLPQKESLSFDIPNMYIQEISAFTDCILNSSDSPIPGSIGLQNQKVIDLAMIGGGRIS